MQQTNCNTHNKARIPATTSQQVHEYCITTSPTTGSQQDDFIWKPGSRKGCMGWAMR